MPVPRETKLLDLGGCGHSRTGLQLGPGHQAATVSERGHCCFLVFAQV